VLVLLRGAGQPASVEDRRALEEIVEHGRRLLAEDCTSSFPGELFAGQAIAAAREITSRRDRRQQARNV
jgi:hypothetical protein